MNSQKEYSHKNVLNNNSFLSKVNRMFFAAVTLAFNIPTDTAAKATSLPAEEALQSLSMQEFKRVLVIAPHPDDETIAPGGLIQAALANGAEVRVLIATNGDGQFGAPALFGKKGLLTAEAYVAMGEARQAESQAALMQLGVHANNIIFLGYPDRGIAPMLEKNWNDTQPYTAPFTRATRNPYFHTYHSQAIYSGESLLADLKELVGDYRPDLIVFSHPADTHTDHAAVSRFTTLAVASIQQKSPAYKPELWSYLVHYGDYPRSSLGDKSGKFLPPADLMNGTYSWGSLELTSGQQGGKSTAIEDYPTQEFLLGSFLPQFVRGNEIFMVVSANQ